MVTEADTKAVGSLADRDHMEERLWSLTWTFANMSKGQSEITLSGKSCVSFLGMQIVMISF